MRSVLVLAALLLAAGSAPAQGPQTIRVASFNILKGNGSAKTLEVIRASGADVVGLQEADGAAPALAKALGWHCREFSSDRKNELGNSDNAILSRYPITQTLRHGMRIELAPGKEAYVFAAHLRAYPYQPYNLRDGDIQAEEQAIRGATNARGAEIDAILEEVKPYVAAGRAVFLIGDFNEPSHLDWTAPAADAGLHALKVAWPTSTKVVAAGLRDAFRAVLPDPVTDPGDTWTPRPEAREIHDRIDFVYAAHAAPTQVKLLGEDMKHADVVISGYPSDHRAVVAAFTVTAEALKPLRTSVNLISNGGAEANPGTATGNDRVLTDWESSERNTPATAQLYGKEGFPSAAHPTGANLFSAGAVTAGDAAHSVIVQTIRLPKSGGGAYTLSGQFGGRGDDLDTAALTATFLDAEERAIGSISIGNVTAAERHNQTRLLARSNKGIVPDGARRVRFTLTFTKAAADSSNDGTADNLSFVLHRR